ncbi:hypothetical protein KL921_002905 [Ogataea angusta]|nr:hypothetical protein KL921_002905 [Ogataea angusta]
MDRGGKRMPLSEITGKLGLNRRPHRIGHRGAQRHVFGDLDRSAQRLSDKYTFCERRVGVRPADLEGAIANRHDLAHKRGFAAAEARRDRPGQSGGSGVFQANIQYQAPEGRSRASGVRVLLRLVRGNQNQVLLSLV